MVIGLVGTCFQILKSAPRPADAMGPWMVLPAIGFVAGLGFFVIRLSGGPGVELPTRPTQSSTPSSMFPPDLEELGKRMSTVMISYQTAESAMAATRWMKTVAGERRQLPQAALKEFIASVRELIDATDRVIALFSEPGFKGNFTRMIEIAQAHGERIPKADWRPEGLQLLRRIYADT